MTIQTDPSLADLQAYADVDYADAHLGFNRLHTDAWETAIEGDKEKALVWASRLLNDYNFRGIKKDIDQVLEWPRNYVAKNPDTSQEAYLNTELPTVLKAATCELAYHLITDDRTLNQEENVGLSNLSVKGLSFTFNSEKTPTVPSYIRTMLVPIISIGKMYRS